MTRQKRITFVELFFYPEVASTGQYFTDLAVHFAQQGCEVEVYTNRAEYLRENQKLPKREVYRGVTIHRLPAFGFSKDKKKGRIVEAMAFTALAFCALFFRRRHGFLFIGTNPPFLPIIGYFLKVLRRWPYVVLLYDLHPQMSARLGWMSEDSFFYKLWVRLNARTYRSADALVPIGRCMQRFMKETYFSKPKGKQKSDLPPMEIIHNWEDGERIKPLPREENPFVGEHAFGDRFVVLYSGSIGLHHELECIIEAAEKLRDQREILFVFIGEGARKDKLQEMVRSKGLQNCLFLPYQPLDNLRYSLTSGDLYVITQERGLEGLIVSCKIYSALASGTEVLGLVHPDTEVAAIIRESDAGVVLDHSDVDGIVRAIRISADNREQNARKGAAGRLYFKEHFEKKISMKAYEDLLGRVFWSEK